MTSAVHSAAKGCGRARGRARKQQHAGNTDSAIVRPGLAVRTADSSHTSHRDPHHGAVPDSSSFSDSSASETNLQEVSVPNGLSVPHSRRSRFDNSMMSIINKHLGQARGERSARSEERGTKNSTLPDGQGPAHRYHLPSPGLRLKIPVTDGATVSVGERPRTVTFPPPAGYRVEKKEVSNECEGRSTHALHPEDSSSSSAPTQSAFRGMHDGRTNAPVHGKGRGRGRARGRAHHGNGDSQELRPGSTPSSCPSHQPPQASHVNQYDDAVQSASLGILTVTAPAKINGDLTNAFDYGDVMSDSEPAVQPVVEKDAPARGLSPHRGPSAESEPEHCVTDRDTSDVRHLAAEVEPLSISLHIPDSSTCLSESQSVSVPGDISDAELPAELSSPAINKADSSSGSGMSPGVMMTPPGHVKVLDWAAEVASPTSPGSPPDWAVPSSHSPRWF